MEIFKRPVKIVYIITLPDLGGAQTHLYEVIVNIINYGYEPILITGREGWLTEKLEMEGIKCHIVTDLIRPIALRHDYRAVMRIKEILRQERPTLVHCHSSKAGVVGRIAAHCSHIPVIFTAHGWAFTDGVKPLKRKIYAFIENLIGYWTNKIICVSEYDRNLGVACLPAHADKMVTIHNCIPDIPTLVRDWQKNPVGDVINIIVVARFSPQKKNLQVLHALRELFNKGLQFTVTFVGDGPQLEIAKSEARRLQIEKEAIFLGARTDVPKLLPQYDLFLLLSNWEGFPISILEAMRASLPVVASNVGGVSEALRTNSAGILLQANDKNFVEIMEDLAHNKEKLIEIGAKGRETFLKKFTVEIMMDEINRQYEQLICM